MSACVKCGEAEVFLPERKPKKTGLSGVKLVILACLASLFACGAARAHSPIPGIEGFYVGFFDPYLAGPQVLALLGLGLVSGTRGAPHAIWLIGAFLLGSLIGVIFGAELTSAAQVLLTTAVACAVLAVLLPERQWYVLIVLVLVGSAYLGAISIPDPGPLGARIVTVSGSFVGLNVGFLYVVGGLLFLKDRYPDKPVDLIARVACAIVGLAAVIDLAVAPWAV